MSDLERLKGKLSLNDVRLESSLDKWFEALGIPDAPVRRSGLRTALNFFKHRMPWLPASSAFGFIMAMDLSRHVADLTLAPGKVLLAFRFPTEPPFKLFFTVPGGSPFNSGILPDGRVATKFKVISTCSVLHSYTSGALDHWSEGVQPLDANSPWRAHTGISPRLGEVGRIVPGGAQQFLIPYSWKHLEVDEDDFLRKVPRSHPRRP